MGYTFFNIGSLTYPEIDALISVQNKHNKEKNRAAKKASKTKKGRRR